MKGLALYSYRVRSQASPASRQRKWIREWIPQIIGSPGLLFLLVATQPAWAAYSLSVQPDNLTVNEHVGGAGEATLVYTFTVPAGQNLIGGGMPEDLYKPTGEDLSIIQIELPVSKRNSLSGEEGILRQTEVGVFDSPKYCSRFDAACYQRKDEGLWVAQRIRPNGTREWLQLATPRVDPTTIGSENTVALTKEIGVFMPTTDALAPGDRVVLKLHGRLPARATSWATRPLIMRLRYRSDPANCTAPDGCWTTLSDDQVQPFHLDPLPRPSFVRIIAPLDVVAGEWFKASIVVTDLFANPTPYTGSVRIQTQGAGNLVYQFDNEYRKDIRLKLPNPGFSRLRVETGLAEVRHVAQWVRAWNGVPTHQRLVGDIHSHTGDGGAQRKFLGTFSAGDHRALFTTQQDAFFYMDKIAGYDFAAVSEHAVRQDSYTLPPAVAMDEAFAAGGACEGATRAFQGLDNWWQLAQQAARSYAQSTDMIVFPAFEWHASHDLALHGDTSPLHRVVLYRDFHPTDELPILPGDIEGIAPQCLVRFIQLAGYGPEEVLIAPHMMSAQPTNIDWDLTYQDSSFANIASRENVDSFHRVGEIFSARAYSKPTYTEIIKAFEGDDDTPGPWSFRYGWRKYGAHLGVIGGSDDHSQMPGSDDTPSMSGVRIKFNEPAGTTFALSSSIDRNGVYDALYERATYATTGVRIWHNFTIDGAMMGQQIASSAATAEALIRIAAGQFITRVELWATRAGDEAIPYQDLLAAEPVKTFYDASVSITNPVAPGATDEEWLYYVRAFFSSPHGDPAHPEDALWSSPIWITWSNP